MEDFPVTLDEYREQVRTELSSSYDIDVDDTETILDKYSKEIKKAFKLRSAPYYPADKIASYEELSVSDEHENDDALDEEYDYERDDEDSVIPDDDSISDEED